MPVNSTNAQYDKASERWRTVRDATAGQEAVKAGRERYLPGFIPADVDRYTQYLKLAYYVNVTGRTKNGLVGAVFRKPYDASLPLSVEYLEDNADGSGNSLEQLSKTEVSDLLQTGRYGLLADYPQAPKGLSQEEVSILGLKASIKPYVAESVINWKTKVVGGATVLSLVVLEEKTDKAIDDYATEQQDQYRVLSLDEGIYTQSVYNKDLELIEGPIIPRKFGGSAWNVIPFVFAGSDDNTPNVGISPLFDLANINLAHYRNVADVESSLRVFSQLMLHVDIGDTSDTQWTEHNPNGIIFGATNGIITRKGKVDVIQANPHNFGTEAVKDKEDQMVSVGARLISKEGVNQTAEEARINASSESSVLDTLVGNASESVEMAIKFCVEFMGGNPEEVEFKLNREYFDSKLSAQEIIAMIQLADRGDIGRSDMRDALRKSGQLSEARTNEDIDSEVGAV